MCNELAFRVAAPDDLPALWSIRNRAARVQCAGHYPPAALETWLAAAPSEGFRHYLQRGHAIVAEQGRNIVGYTVVDVGERELEALFVAPDHFRRGCGSQLLARAEELASQEGIVTLTLSAALNAIDFYLAHDYELLAIDDYAHRSGVRLKRGVMQKSLKISRRSS